MAKKDVDMDKQRLEQEIAELKAKVAEQERVNAEVSRLSSTNLANEINTIRRKGNSQASIINVVEKPDHKNISLWTKWGKRIGPMHPDNAIELIQERGGVLSTKQPTAEEVEAWYASAEGKAFVKSEQDKRKLKLKSKRAGSMEVLAQKMADLHGVVVNNRILSQSEVR
jgi:hypothetical protein